MKKLFATICIAGLLAMAGAAYAGLEYYEGFDYPEGDPTTLHGWTTGASSIPYAIDAPGATYALSGFYCIPDVPAGTYDVAFKAASSLKTTITGTTVVPAGTATCDATHRN